ncbi:MAG: hypothetical protein DRJ42_27560 [Deltaproteobacteria bacterium]|nr:MAG: hypothetical protein DRJ42_27560 [Deltaproteobacteria bacterium]
MIRFRRLFSPALAWVVVLVLGLAACGRIGFDSITDSAVDSAPAEETCDGVDNDGDGVIDEGFECVIGDTAACTTGCSSDGVRECIAGCAFDACVPPPEVCNGADDDCDGAIDDGFACVSGQVEACSTSCGSTGSQGCDVSCAFDACAAPPEDCNGADDDCDGMSDEGFACAGGGVSSCVTMCGSTGSRTCFADCTLDICTPPVEVCNGVDDDCDGARDDGFACIRGETMPCMTSCGTTGARVCSGMCEFGACVPPPEACNGLDDDCDMAIDEGSLCTPGEMMACTTTCGSAGTQTCSALCVFDACAPPAEICNGMDDDCDGATDEGFACVPASSGPCLTGCGSTGSQTCDATCALGVCVAPPESCNGADDDCDGIDDEGFACVQGSTSGCTTGCGSAGTRTCSGTCTLGVCDPPVEICNGVDDDCDAMADEGFACRAGASEACTTGCGSAGTRSCLGDCTWDVCVPPAEQCNGADDDCDLAVDEGFNCIAGEVGICTTGCGSTGTRACSGMCEWGMCSPPVESCSGVDDDCDGVCDNGFACCRGTTTPCSALGLGVGTATCPIDCSAWETSNCTTCGNGSIDTPEECDMADFGTETCTTQGFTGGTLTCTSGCIIDTGMCTGSDPNGTYSISPIISYSCVGGLVNFTIDEMTFADDGMNLDVSVGPTGPLGGCSSMSGDTATDGSFTVSCIYTGTCDETYTLTGMFTDAGTWTGNYTAEFSGSCFDCTNQNWPVTGTRL